MRQTIISFQLTRVEKEIIESVFYLEPWLPETIDYRRRKGDKFQIKLADDEIKDLIDALLFQAENEPVNATKFISLAEKIHQFRKILGKTGTVSR